MTVTEEWLQVRPFASLVLPLFVVFIEKKFELTRARSVGCKREACCPSDGRQSASAGSSPVNLNAFFCLLPLCAVEPANARFYRLARYIYFDDACA